MLFINVILFVKVEKLTMNNYDKELENILKQLDVDDVYQKAYNLALQKVTNQVKQNEGKIRAEVEKVVQENVKEQVTNADSIIFCTFSLFIC